MKISVAKDVQEKLGQLIKGINVMPSTVRNSIISDLTSGVENSKADKIFNEESGLEILTEKEMESFLKKIYNFSKDETFNPSKMVEQKQTRKQAKSKYANKPKKDDIPDYYFDYDFKVQFASRYQEQTTRVVKALFRKTAPVEKKYNKDLYQFNIRELEEVLKTLNAKTIRSLQSSISKIEQYIDFAYKEGRISTQVNLANQFDSKDKIKKYLNEDAEENMIFEKDDIMAMAEESDNPQDGVILALLFDGLSRKNEFEELVELTKDDVDFDFKKVNLDNRTISISHETKMLIEDALKEDTYYSINGEKVRKYKITEGNYILRGLRNKLKVKAQMISQRIMRIADKNAYKYLNATTVSYSGQVYYAKQMMDNGLSIEEAINEVMYRFNIPNNNSSQFYLKSRIEKYLQSSDS